MLQLKTLVECQTIYTNQSLTAGYGKDAQLPLWAKLLLAFEYRTFVNGLHQTRYATAYTLCRDQATTLQLPSSPKASLWLTRTATSTTRRA